MLRPNNQKEMTVDLVSNLWARFCQLLPRRGGVRAQEGALAILDQGVVSVASFATTLLLGRLAGPNELGIYSLGFTIIVLIVTIHDALISTPYTIYASRLHDNARAEYAGSVLIHHAVFGALASAGLVVLGLCIQSGIGPVSLRTLVWLMPLVLPFWLLREFGRRVAFAHLHCSLGLRISLTLVVVQLTGLYVLVMKGSLSAATALAVLGLGSAISGLSWLMTTRGTFAPQWQRAFTDWRNNWSFGRWLLATEVTAVVGANLMPWLLALLLGPAAIGMYAACIAIVFLSNPIVLGFVTILRPRAAKAFADGGPAEVRQVVRDGMLWLGGFMTLLCLFVSFVGGTALCWLFGNEYSGNHLSIFVLAVSALVNAIGVAASCGLLAFERSDVNFRARLVGLITTLVMGLALVPVLGVLGAACGHLLGRTASTVVTLTIYARVSHRVETRAGN